MEELEAEGRDKRGKRGPIPKWKRRFGALSSFLSCSCCKADNNSEKLLMMEEKLDKKLDELKHMMNDERLEKRLNQVEDVKTTSLRNRLIFCQSY